MIKHQLPFDYYRLIELVTLGDGASHWHGNCKTGKIYDQQANAYSDDEVVKQLWQTGRSQGRCCGHVCDVQVSIHVNFTFVLGCH